MKMVTVHIETMNSEKGSLGSGVDHWHQRFLAGRSLRGK